MSDVHILRTFFHGLLATVTQAFDKMTIIKAFIGRKINDGASREAFWLLVIMVLKIIMLIIIVKEVSSRRSRSLCKPVQLHV